MKKLIVFMFFTIGLINPSIGQDNTYGLSFGMGNGLIIRPALDGGASYDLNTGYSLGFDYNRKLKDNLHFQTGLSYYSNTVSVTPGFYPGMDMSPRTYDVSLLYIPVFLKVDLFRYFFVNGGLMIDIDLAKNNRIASQSGIGSGIGIGTNIVNTEKIGIQLNPYLNLHGLIMANQKNYPERMLDAGIKLIVVVK